MLIKKYISITESWLRHVILERHLHGAQTVWLTTTYSSSKHSAKAKPLLYIIPGEPSHGSTLLLSLQFLSEKEFLLQQQMPPGTNWHSLSISEQRLMKYLLSLRGSEEVISPAQNWDSVMRQDKNDSSANAHSLPVLTVKEMGFIHMFKESREPLCKTKSDNTAVHCSWGQGSQRKGKKMLLLQTISHLMHFIAWKNYLWSSRG